VSEDREEVLGGKEASVSLHHKSEMSALRLNPGLHGKKLLTKK
jgi:hypothetical protein